MANSMTGFGRSTLSKGQTTITVEVKTVNHRFIEYYFRMPRNFAKLEDSLRKIISSTIKRGRVEIYVHVEGEGLLKRKLHIDFDLIDQYLQYIQEIEQTYQLPSNVTVSELLRRDDLIHVEEQEIHNEQIEQLLTESLKLAVLSCQEMRSREGKVLATTIQNYLASIQVTIAELTGLASLVVEYYGQRLRKRIKDMISEPLDEARLIQEVALFADKADISEELARLASHVGQFSTILTLGEPIGRQLDFLIQEMNREVNTIGAKANDARLQTMVVSLKSTLEKMKEQVQNIE